MRGETVSSPLAASPSRRTMRRRVARIITELFAPVPVATILLFVVAWHSTHSLARSLVWGGVSALFATLVPLLYLLRGVRRRQFTDRHVRLRQQRPLAFLVGIASLLIGLALMVVLGAPRELLALIAAMGVGLIVSLLVTLLWKISVHVAVVAGAVVILVLVFGPLLLILGPLVALVGWARVEVADHTPAQGIAGSALGATVAAVVFMLLR